MLRLPITSLYISNPDFENTKLPRSGYACPVTTHGRLISLIPQGSTLLGQTLGSLHLALSLSMEHIDTYDDHHLILWWSSYEDMITMTHSKNPHEDSCYVSSKSMFGLYGQEHWKQWIKGKMSCCVTNGQNECEDRTRMTKFIICKKVWFDWNWPSTERQTSRS